jgi:O-antigen/teichoic acid export membrane protein
MGAILLLFTAVNKIDTLILALLKGNSAVGIYALTYRVYDVVILAAAYLMSSVLPLLVQEYISGRGRSKVRELLKRIAAGMGLLVLVMLATVWLAAPLIIWVLTQKRFEEFGEAVGVLRILTLAAGVAYFNHLTGYTLVALGEQKRYLKVPILALIFNVGLNFLLIPRWSYFAAAWVTVATEGLALILSTRCLYEALKE